jgi:putative ABC transport system substrate-binding protein
MRRREFITLLGGGLVAWPFAGHAQQPRKVPRIGVLLPGTPASFSLRTKAFLEGLRNLGYVEGQTIEIEWKWGQDKVDGLPALAAELVARNVDVLITGGTPAAKALKSATGATPIVMAIIGDPVAFLSALAAGVPPVMMTSTLCSTSAAASPGSPSTLSSPHFHSMAIVCPST